MVRFDGSNAVVWIQTVATTLCEQVGARLESLLANASLNVQLYDSSISSANGSQPPPTPPPTPSTTTPSVPNSPRLRLVGRDS